MKERKVLPAHEICFGLDRTTDELSIKSFIKRFASDKLLEVMVPKLTDSEINQLLDCMSNIMKKHLSEQEYL